MNPAPSDPTADFYALTYDASVPDWPGEIDFYQELAAQARRNNGKVLEIACGTGRVTIRLAQHGGSVVGLDLSPQMLAIAQTKSAGLDNLRWVHGDMRSFDLGESFGLAIIPGHSFQNLNSVQDQVACLECTKRHLQPGGVLAVHLDPPDVSWLGDLLREEGGRFEPAEQFPNPESGRQVRTFRAWSYEPASPSAICQTRWEELDADARLSIAGRTNRPACTASSGSRWSTCWPGLAWWWRQSMGISCAARWRTTVRG